MVTAEEEDDTLEAEASIQIETEASLLTTTRSRLYSHLNHKANK